MSKTVLLVGTRKGCFLLESDEGRSDWKLRGPFCEGWPIYHAIPTPTTGAIYVAAASEWHGSSVWRSRGPRRDLAAVERGPQLRRHRAQALEGVGPHRDQRPAVRRCRDARSVRKPRRRRDMVAPDDARGPAGKRVVERPGESAARAPGRAGDPSAPRRSVPVLGDRAGHRHLRDDGRRRVVDASQPRDCARTGRSRIQRSATASTSS